MHTAVYRYKVDHRINEAVRLGHNEFVPMIKQIPGFVAHYAIDLGDNEGLLLAVFDDEAGIKQFAKVAEDWVQKRIVPTLGHPYDQPPIHFAIGKVKAYNTPQDRHLDIP
jgi:hypothetical protein